jgi:hypothetical protein
MSILRPHLWCSPLLSDAVAFRIFRVAVLSLLLSLCSFWVLRRDRCRGAGQESRKELQEEGPVALVARRAHSSSGHVGSGVCFAA